MKLPIARFRAWDECHELMHYDFEYITSGHESNDWIVFRSNLQPLTMKHHPLQNPYFQQQLKVMQCAEMTDSNDALMYVGDIVEITHPIDGAMHGIIVFNPLKGQFGWQEIGTNEIYSLTSGDKCNTVVGNIYQNVDLLHSLEGAANEQ